MTIEFYEGWSGQFLKRWDNWYGAIPHPGDTVILNIENQDSAFDVKFRMISGMAPDKVKVIVAMMHKVENYIEADGWL